MKRILIIEDEQPAARRLSKLVLETAPGAEIVAVLDSIDAAASWFRDHPAPELVFMDIHLADGSAFDLLKQVKVPAPVIFTTAYDQYALEAFKTSGLDYLLKPVKKQDLEQAFQKLVQLKDWLKDTATLESGKPAYKTRFMVRFGEHIKTVLVEQIAYCYSENKATFARCFDGRSYPLDHNLDALEGMLDPEQFFRINRQYLISLKSIEEMRTYTKARVIIRLQPPVKEAPVVSSERAADFKSWLSGDLH